MAQLNLKKILSTDNISELVDIINHNFDQIVLNGGGPAGARGIIGSPGLPGLQGIQGVIGGTGEDGTKLFVSSVDPGAYAYEVAPREYDVYMKVESTSIVVYEYDGSTWNIVNTVVAPAGASKLIVDGIDETNVLPSNANDETVSDSVFYGTANAYDPNRKIISQTNPLKFSSIYSSLPDRSLLTLASNDNQLRLMCTTNELSDLEFNRFGAGIIHSLSRDAGINTYAIKYSGTVGQNKLEINLNANESILLLGTLDNKAVINPDSNSVVPVGNLSVNNSLVVGPDAYLQGVTINSNNYALGGILTYGNLAVGAINNTLARATLYSSRASGLDSNLLIDIDSTTINKSAKISLSVDKYLNLLTYNSWDIDHYAKTTDGAYKTLTISNAYNSRNDMGSYSIASRLNALSFERITSNYTTQPEEDYNYISIGMGIPSSNKALVEIGNYTNNKIYVGDCLSDNDPVLTSTLLFTNEPLGFTLQSYLGFNVGRTQEMSSNGNNWFSDKGAVFASTSNGSLLLSIVTNVSTNRTSSVLFTNEPEEDYNYNRTPMIYSFGVTGLNIGSAREAINNLQVPQGRSTFGWFENMLGPTFGIAVLGPGQFGTSALDMWKIYNNTSSNNTSSIYMDPGVYSLNVYNSNDAGSGSGGIRVGTRLNIDASAHIFVAEDMVFSYPDLPISNRLMDIKAYTPNYGAHSYLHGGLHLFKTNDDKIIPNSSKTGESVNALFSIDVNANIGGGISTGVNQGTTTRPTFLGYFRNRSSNYTAAINQTLTSNDYTQKLYGQSSIERSCVGAHGIYIKCDSAYGFPLYIDHCDNQRYPLYSAYNEVDSSLTGYDPAFTVSGSGGVTMGKTLIMYRNLRLTGTKDKVDSGAFEFGFDGNDGFWNQNAGAHNLYIRNTGTEGNIIIQTKVGGGSDGDIILEPGGCNKGIGGWIKLAAKNTGSAVFVQQQQDGNSTCCIRAQNTCDTTSDTPAYLQMETRIGESTSIEGFIKRKAKGGLHVCGDGSGHPLFLGDNYTTSNGTIKYSNVVLNFGNNEYTLGRHDITSYVSASDRRYKNNLLILDDAINIIKKLTPYTFNWNEEYIKSFIKSTGIRKPDDNAELEVLKSYEEQISEYRDMCSHRELGFIAQDIEEIIPEVVRKDSEGMYGIQYDKMVALLTKAVQEQQELIESKDKTIKNLEDRLAAIEKHLNL